MEQQVRETVRDQNSLALDCTMPSAFVDPLTHDEPAIKTLKSVVSLRMHCAGAAWGAAGRLQGGGTQHPQAPDQHLRAAPPPAGTRT